MAFVFKLTYLIVGGDILLDGGQRRALGLLQSLDGGHDHSGRGWVSGLGLRGLLGRGFLSGGGFRHDDDVVSVNALLTVVWSLL